MVTVLSECDFSGLNGIVKIQAGTKLGGCIVPYDGFPYVVAAVPPLGEALSPSELASPSGRGHLNESVGQIAMSAECWYDSGYCHDVMPATRRTRTSCWRLRAMTDAVWLRRQRRAASWSPPLIRPEVSGRRGMSRGVILSS